MLAKSLRNLVNSRNNDNTEAVRIICESIRASGKWHFKIDVPPTWVERNLSDRRDDAPIWHYEAHHLIVDDVTISSWSKCVVCDYDESGKWYVVEDKECVREMTDIVAVAIKALGLVDPEPRKIPEPTR